MMAKRKSYKNAAEQSEEKPILEVEILIPTEAAIRRIICAARLKLAVSEESAHSNQIWWRIGLSKSFSEQIKARQTERYVPLNEAARAKKSANDLCFLLKQKDAHTDLFSKVIDKGFSDKTGLNNFIERLHELSDALGKVSLEVAVTPEKPKRRKDNSQLMALHLLSQLFEFLFKRKPTFNNRPSSGGAHSSPFLRFASQALMEYEQAGLRIMSSKPAAIRARMSDLPVLRAQMDECGERENILLLAN
jgi:hypothetical protein